MGRYAIDTKYTAMKSGTDKDSNSWFLLEGKHQQTTD